MIRTPLGKAILCAPLLILLRASPAAPVPGLPDGVAVRQLGPKAWLIESKVEIPGFGLVPCNNLLLTGSRDSVLLDALTTDLLTDSVLEWAASELHRPVRELIVTEAHDDRIGGIGAAHRRGVVSHALPLTRSLAQQGGWPVPLREIRSGDTLNARGLRMHIYFPGHGHAPDNLPCGLLTHTLSPIRAQIAKQSRPL